MDRAELTNYLSYVCTIIYALQRLEGCKTTACNGWRQFTYVETKLQSPNVAEAVVDSDNMNLLILGACEEFEGQVSDLWAELLNFFPGSRICIYLIGPGMHEQNTSRSFLYRPPQNTYSSCMNQAFVTVHHYSGVFHDFAEANPDLVPTAAFLFNSGLGCGIYDLTMSWLPSLVKLLRDKTPMICTSTNEKDAAGEIQILGHFLQSSFVLPEHANQFRSLCEFSSSTESEDVEDINARSNGKDQPVKDSDTNTSHANGICYAIQGSFHDEDKLRNGTFEFEKEIRKVSIDFEVYTG